MTGKDSDASLLTVREAHRLARTVDQELKSLDDTFDADVAMAATCYRHAASAAYLIAGLMSDERVGELGERYRPSQFQPEPEPIAAYKTLTEEEDHLPPVERLLLLLGDLRYELHREYETVDAYRDMVARCRPVAGKAVAMLQDMLPKGRKPDL